jgi:hypothetical protein
MSFADKKKAEAFDRIAQFVGYDDHPVNGADLVDVVVTEMHQVAAQHPVEQLGDPVMLMAGDPIDGFRFYGPFETFDEAGDWAENEGVENPWWTTNVQRRRA